jgi:ribA/ribD-fused uncharacterized protein
MTIYFYGKKEEPYGCFSNFSDHGFYLDGYYWYTVEHYFQGQKFLDPVQQERIAKNSNPMDAKKMGRAPGLREGWDELRDDVMRRGVLKKFQTHAEIREILLNTGEEELVESSPYDYYWGCGAEGTGKNRLGQILMETRTILREQGLKEA